MEYWSSGKNQGFGIIATTFYVSGLKTEFLKISEILLFSTK